MKVEALAIEGLFVLEPKIFEDERGHFFESYHKEKLNAALGRQLQFIQDNEALSCFGVIRGLHFQIPPFAQTKLVRVVHGEILDVALDIRKTSATYGQHIAIVLSAENQKQFLIPEGFAHGYAVLSSQAIVQYKVNQHYHPQHEQSILLSDEDLKIDWQLKTAEWVISTKDKMATRWAKFETPF